MNKTFAFSLLVSFAALFSCSKGGGGGSKAPEQQNTDSLETEMYGTYQAILAPLNKDVSGHLNGTVSVIRERNDDIVIDVRFSSGPKSVLHNQSIHVGSRCPTEADDLNGDGYIDGQEGASVYEGIIIPLDDDISSQRIGLGIFPVSDEYGYYLWSRTTPFAKLMNDLHEEDINLTDDYVKLSSDKSLSMLGKVAVIMGVPADTVLPETVEGRGRLMPHQAIPVACGVIRRIGHPPGQIDTDHTGIPVPADGETIGGSSGADDGAVFTPVTPGGDYGEEEPIEIVAPSNETEHGSTTGNGAL